VGGLYKPRTGHSGRTGRCMNHASAILAAPALIYSTHRLLVVWIIGLPVNSSHGHLVTRSTRHQSTCHTSVSSHSQLVTSEHIGLTKPPPIIIFGRPFVKRSPYAIGPGKGYFAECGKLSTGNLRKILCGFFSAE